MLVELKDRLLSLVSAAPGEAKGAGETVELLRSALSNLGFRGAEVEGAVSALRMRAVEGAGLEALLPEALRLLRG